MRIESLLRKAMSLILISVFLLTNNAYALRVPHQLKGDKGRARFKKAEQQVGSTTVKPGRYKFVFGAHGDFTDEVPLYINSFDLYPGSLVISDYASDIEYLIIEEDNNIVIWKVEGDTEQIFEIKNRLKEVDVSKNKNIELGDLNIKIITKKKNGEVKLDKIVINTQPGRHGLAQSVGWLIPVKDYDTRFAAEFQMNRTEVEYAVLMAADGIKDPDAFIEIVRALMERRSRGVDARIIATNMNEVKRLEKKIGLKELQEWQERGIKVATLKPEEMEDLNKAMDSHDVKVIKVNNIRIFNIDTKISEVKKLRTMIDNAV